MNRNTGHPSEPELSVEARDLVVAYGRHEALKGVSITIRAGEVLGLLGPNGAGKSTFVKSCLGLIRPRSGVIRVLGLDPVAHGQEVRRKVGFVLEKTGLYSSLSCRANLELHGEIYRVNPRYLSTRVNEILQKFDLTSRADAPVSSLSKGLSQRLALARALLHEPRILLLDEPTSGLDPTAAREVRRLIMSVVREGATTVLLTTHNIIEAERMCNRVVILHQGKVLRMLDTHELTTVAGVRVRCRTMSSALAEEIADMCGAEEVSQHPDATEFVFAAGTEAEGSRQAVAEAGGEVIEVVQQAGGLEVIYFEALGRSRNK